MTSNKSDKLFKYQLWHFLALMALLVPLYFIAEADSSVISGELFGVNTATWYYLSIASAVLHQIYVVVCWRLELHHKSISQRFGKSGFKIFKAGFAFLILSRPVTITLLAFSNSYSLEINSTLSYLAAILLFIPAAYLAYSVRKFFGIDQAFGIDHFYPESFRDTKLVKRGIFKYSGNAMYVFGFLSLYIPGILLQSKGALLVALFHHLYIWVHYYCTEKPDMQEIYGNG